MKIRKWLRRAAAALLVLTAVSAVRIPVLASGENADTLLQQLISLMQSGSAYAIGGGGRAQMQSGSVYVLSAEGVEQWEQVEFLKSVDINMVQGFLFDKPLPRDEFEKRLKGSRIYQIPDKK